jgi:hypothetical protein
MRKDLGHSASMALVKPAAPSGVMVTGGCSPRLANPRNTSQQLSELSLWVVERLSKTLRPSSPIAQTHRTPVLFPQRRKGS